MKNIVGFSELQQSGIGWEFEGCKFDNADITFIIVDAAPGKGTALHNHPYDEVIIVLDGLGLFTIGGIKTEVSGGKIIRIPAGVPHKFINIGSNQLRQVDIHLNRKFITEWLPEYS